MGRVMGALTKATNGNFDKPAAAQMVGAAWHSACKKGTCKMGTDPFYTSRQQEEVLLPVLF